MTPHQIIVVGLRLLAIIWLLLGIGTLIGAYPQIGPNPGAFAIATLAFAVLQVIPCVVLWFFPATLARKLLPSPKNDVVSPAPAGATDWLTLGFIGIGVWGLIRGLIDTVYWVTFVAMSADFDFDLLPEHKANILATVVELGICTWLIFGARGLAAILWKLRTGGVSKEAS